METGLLVLRIVEGRGKGCRVGMASYWKMRAMRWLGDAGEME